jgi:hypothetical protein
MKVETAKTCLILLLMAYALETWPWVEQSFRNEEARQATVELETGVRGALEQAYQESQAAQEADKMRALGEVGAKLRDHGLRQIEDNR